METIIKKAIEGGYKNGFTSSIFVKDTMFLYRDDGLENHIKLEESCIDPLFWQALGKACGWDVQMKDARICEKECSKDIYYTYNFCPKCGAGFKPFEKMTSNWLTKAKKFHEINLTEGWDAAVKYLESLVSNSEIQ